MDEANLTVLHCTVGDVLEILGPYVWDHLRRNGRSWDQLGIFVNSFHESISIQASTVKGSAQRVTFMTMAMKLREDLPPPAVDKLCIDFVGHTPREHMVYFRGYLGMDAVREMLPTMPKIQELYLTFALLSDGSLQPDPDGPFANTKLLPSL
jgi:hypothetical protein